MSVENYWIPRTLDDPPMMLFFQADTAILFITVFLIGISFTVIGATILAFFLARIYVQLKENGERGFIMQLLYWYSPSEFWAAPIWSSSVREYCGK